MSTSMQHSHASGDSVRDLVSWRLLAQVMPTWSTRRSRKILRPSVVRSTATATAYRRGVPQGQFVTVVTAGWRSTSRSDDGQTILEAVPTAHSRSMTWTFGRDGGIRTRGLLLPKQARCQTAPHPDGSGSLPSAGPVLLLASRRGPVARLPASCAPRAARPSHVRSHASRRYATGVAVTPR